MTDGNGGWDNDTFSFTTLAIDIPGGSSGGGYVPINIKILDGEGNPVAFHYLYLYQDGCLKDRAVTNQEGLVDFIVLPGTYIVQAMLDGELRELTIVVEPDSENNHVLSFFNAPYPQFRLDSTEFLIFFFIIVAVIVFIVCLKKITTKK